MKLWTKSLRNTARRPSRRDRAGSRNVSRFACVEALEARWAFAAHTAFDAAQQFEVDGRPTQAYTNYLLSTLTTTGTDEIAAFVDAPISKEIPALSAQSSSLIRLNTFRADARFAGIDGRGFSSVIIDSGIDLNHSFFGPDNDGNGIADRIVFQHDFADNDRDASDRDGHGSNVSGIVASASQQFPGMAPGTNIIHLKVFSDFGGGASFEDIEAALQWVVANTGAFNISSVNLSLGSGNAASPVSSPLNDEYAALAQMGVITTVAAGNSFFGFGSTPGVNELASSPNVLAVSATWDGNFGSVQFGDGATDFTTGSDRITSFSQRHPTLTAVFAPGAMITNASHNGGTVTMPGTSQAAPHVAGVATLMQQLAVEQLGRRLTFAEFKALLRNTGPVIVDGDDENDNVTNTGMSGRRLDVMSLAEAIVGTAPTAGDRFEANETFATATNLGALGTRSEANLSIHTAGDDDVYRFTASATGEFTARLSFSHAAGDIDAAMFDANGNRIALSDSINDSELLTAEVIAGQTYFVHVFGF
jgi:subtilisin family serine protease